MLVPDAELEKYEPCSFEDWMVSRKKENDFTIATDLKWSTSKEAKALEDDMYMLSETVRHSYNPSYMKMPWEFRRLEELPGYAVGTPLDQLFPQGFDELDESYVRWDEAAKCWRPRLLKHGTDKTVLWQKPRKPLDDEQPTGSSRWRPVVVRFETGGGCWGGPTVAEEMARRNLGPRNAENGSFIGERSDIGPIDHRGKVLVCFPQAQCVRFKSCLPARFRLVFFVEPEKIPKVHLPGPGGETVTLEGANLVDALAITKLLAETGEMQRPFGQPNRHVLLVVPQSVKALKEVVGDVEACVNKLLVDSDIPVLKIDSSNVGKAMDVVEEHKAAPVSLLGVCRMMGDSVDIRCICTVYEKRTTLPDWTSAVQRFGRASRRYGDMEYFEVVLAARLSKRLSTGTLLDFLEGLDDKDLRHLSSRIATYSKCFGAGKVVVEQCEAAGLQEVADGLREGPGGKGGRGGKKSKRTKTKGGGSTTQTQIVETSLEDLKELLEQVRVTRAPPPRLEMARLLSAYAAAHDGSFPLKTATHPDNPEWKWGNWSANLLRDYLAGTLHADVRAAMDACPYWSAKREKRERKATQQPIPTRKERVRLLSEYAAANDGSFPVQTATHPEYPEWKWGMWATDLSKHYLDGELKDDVRAAMDACSYWCAKLAAGREDRERKATQQPIPTRKGQVRLLSAYAAAHDGSFPVQTRTATHPEYPEWKWGNWVGTLSREYLAGKLKDDVRAAMDACSYWRARLAAWREKREKPIPARKEQVRLLSAYAAANGGSFPVQTAAHPEYPGWKWGNWVNTLSTDYLAGKLKDDVREAMDACSYWRAKLAARREKGKKREAKKKST